MKFFELQEILNEELKDPEFRAMFEAEKKVLAAERLLAERAQMFFSRYKKHRTTKRPFTLHRPRPRARATA